MFFDLAPLALTIALARDPVDHTRDPVNVEAFVQARSRSYGVSETDVRGPSRDRELVRIRQAIAADLRARGYSLPRIGRALNRHHTSILALLRAHARSDQGL